MSDIQPYIDQIVSAINQAGSAIAQNLKTQVKTVEELFDEAKKAVERDDFVHAEQIYRMLIQNDKHPLAYSIVFSYSYLLLRNARYEEAIDMLKRGITLNPNVPEFYTNIAYALSRMHKHEESIPYYKKAIEIKPDHYKSLFDLGLVYLRLGDFAQGWKLHEYRNYRPAPENFSDRYLQGKLPRWDGNPESLRGKKVFVSKEQGFGDGMQFFRYVEPLSKIASHVTFSCEPYLKKLFEASNIWDNVTITDDFENVEPHDVWLYQMSLPVVVPEVENRAYLKAMPDTPVPKLPDGGFKVGIAWQGNPKHINDKNRSLKLSQFDHFPKNATYFSLQANIHDANEVSRSKLGMTDVTRSLIDFNDTAKFIEQLDLVISIDSAPIHLAGALGKKCWVYVPYDGSDWRWGKFGTQSNLYSDITAYWQDKMYNYDVLDRMAVDLTKLIESRNR